MERWIPDSNGAGMRPGVDPGWMGVGVRGLGPYSPVICPPPLSESGSLRHTSTEGYISMGHVIFTYHEYTYLW